MENKILIIQNSHEGPGIIPQILKDEQIEFDIADLNNGDSLQSILNYKAIFILGGPDSVNDQSEKMLNELARLQEALNNNVSILGICLGCQALVKIAGGKVLPGDKPEVGLRDPNGNIYQVNLTEAGKIDPLLNGLDEKLKVFELHGEVIELTPKIQLLATGPFVRNQIVKVFEKSYGVLCHLEIVPDELKNWFLLDATFNAIDKDKLLDDFASIQEEYFNNGRRLIKNFLSIAGF